MKNINSLTLNRFRFVFSFSFFLLTAIFLIKNPSLASQSIHSAINLCVKNVIPSLFPFLILNGILLRSAFPYYASKIFSKLTQRLFGINGASSFPFITGLISGFPIGAKNTVSLYKDGIISKEEAEILICYCNNIGPAFALFTVGKSFFNDIKIGAILYFSVVLSAFLTGIILGRTIKKSDVHRAGISYSAQKFSVSFSEAISESAISMAVICAFVIFFKLINDIVRFPISYLKLSPILSAVVSGFLEITNGASMASGFGKEGVILCGFLFGWSSMSVHMQSAAFILPEGISMKKYYLSKVFQGFTTALIAAACLYLLKI